jgi:peptide/nickel transport system permease protein
MAITEAPELDSVGSRPITRPARWWDTPIYLLRRFARIRLAMPGLVIVLFMVLVALAADVISPYDPIVQNYRQVRQPPTWQHPFGTDEVGRDVLSRVIYGTRVSLEAGMVAVGLALLFGVSLGLVAGYSRGFRDSILMRTMDAIQSFPGLALALGITAALGTGLTNAMIAIGIVYTPLFARLVRGQALTLREMDFIEAARALGVRPHRIMIRHILPNLAGPLLVQSSLAVSTAIIAEASLSFLGVGVAPPTPSWGSMIRSGYVLMESAPWLSFFPGAAIFITVLGLNFLGDGLRELLDPKLRRIVKEQ